MTDLQDLETFVEYNKILDEEAMKALKELNAPKFSKAVKEYVPPDGSILKDYYDTIWTGNHVGLDSARELIKICTFEKEPRPNAVDVRESFVRVVNGNAPTTVNEIAVARLMLTRPARWKILADRLGTAVPKSFLLWRGVNNEKHDFVADVYKSWKNGTALKLIHRETSCWSMNSKIPEYFAKCNGWSIKGGVVFNARIPFVDTIADKWVDDAGFLIPWYYQDEVLVGTKQPDSIVPISEKTIVWLGDVRYTFDDREKFFSACQAINPALAGII